MSNLRSFLAPALALVLIAPIFAISPVEAQERRQLPDFTVHGSPAQAEDEAAVRAVADAFRDAWGREATDELMALHSPDTEWINAYARMFQSRDALGEFLEHRLFPDFPDGVSAGEAAAMRLVSLRFVGRDAAVIHIVTDGDRGASRNAGEDQRRTHMHLVLERRDAGWLIVHTAIMDARN